MLHGARASLNTSHADCSDVKAEVQQRTLIKNAAKTQVVRVIMSANDPYGIHILEGQPSPIPCELHITVTPV